MSNHARARSHVQDQSHLFRQLPQVQGLLERADAGALCAEFGRAVVTDALREALDVVRAQIGVGALAAVPDAPPFIVLAAPGLARPRHRAPPRPLHPTGMLLPTPPPP